MTTGIINNQGMGNVFLGKFPGSQLGALVPWPGFIHADVNGYSGLVGSIDRRSGRAVIHKGQPAGIAVGENIDRFTIFAIAYLFDDLQSVLADAAAEFSIFIGDLAGRDKCGLLYLGNSFTFC